MLALLLGGHIAAANMYMVGLTAFDHGNQDGILDHEFTESGPRRGYLPLEVLPDWLYRIARWSPFACLNYNPARIYLELSGPELVVPGLVWAAIVTVIAQALTVPARRKLEVQGG